LDHFGVRHNYPIIFHPDPVSGEIAALMASPHSQRLSDFSGTVGPGGRGHSLTTTAHGFNPLGDFYSPNQNGLRGTSRTRHEIQHVVQAVTQVNISLAAGGKQHFRPRSAPVVVTMAGPILRAPISFGLGNKSTANPGGSPDAKFLAQKKARQVQHIRRLVSGTRKLHRG
jgi:hypothetical protein